MFALVDEEEVSFIADRRTRKYGGDLASENLECGCIAIAIDGL